MYNSTKLKEVRKYLDITQKEASEALNISQPYYSALEKGKRELTNKIIADIKAVFNIDKSFFEIDNKEDYLSLKIAGKQKDNKWAVDAGLSYDVSKAPQSKEVKYSGGIDDNKVDFYYHHSEYRLDKLLSTKIAEFKSIFESEVKLMNTITYIGRNKPEILEAFSSDKDFKTYKNQTDKELKEYNSHIEDEKLYKAIRLVNYEYEIEQRIRSLEIRINKFASFKHAIITSHIK